MTTLNPNTPIMTLAAGKSAVINSLLGGRFLAEGILPTTNEISVLKHAADGLARDVQESDGFYTRYLPSPVRLLSALFILCASPLHTVGGNPRSPPDLKTVIAAGRQHRAQARPCF